MARIASTSRSRRRLSTGRTCRHPTEACAYQVPRVPCLAKMSVSLEVYSARCSSGTAQSSTKETGFPSSFIDIMMLRAAVRVSPMAACSFGSKISTTPPHLAPSLSQPSPRAPITSLSCMRRRRLWYWSSSANSTKRMASGSPRTTASMVGRNIAMFRPTIEAVVRGDPEAILFVEFAEDDQYHNLRRLMQLKDVIGALGLGWDKLGAKWGGVVEIFDPKLQAAIGETRTAALNIMMSMKEEGKPVSFVEDCAVPLEHLAEYTAKLTDIFENHGTRGTWYVHASVGCLHVRPVLNLRLDKAFNARRAIA